MSFHHRMHNRPDRLDWGLLVGPALLALLLLAVYALAFGLAP